MNESQMFEQAKNSLEQGNYEQSVGCDLQLINHRCVKILAFANSQYDF